MSETPYTEPSSATDVTESLADPSFEPEPEPASEPPPVSHASTPEPAPRGSKLPFWLSVAALVLAVLAVTGAALGWFFPNKSASSPTYTDQQVKDAKTHICAAFLTVDRAVVRNTHLKNPPEGGPIGALAVATSARLALYGGGSYLQDHVSIEPAAAPDLAKAADNLAVTLQDLGMGYLASAPEFTQDEQRHKLEGEIKALAGFCK
jgi:hypothetical protein